jgi:hypothetical protein
LIRQTHFGLGRDLRGLKYDYGVSDIEQEKSLDKYKVLFIPCAEFMDTKIQTLLLEQVKKGKTLILYGLLPKYDLSFKRSEILTKALKIKTAPLYSVNTIQVLKTEFQSLVYGYVKTHPKNFQVIAWADRRVVGLKGRLGKGRVYLFTFDLSTSFSHRKLSFLDGIITDAGVTRYLNCSDAEVEIIVQRNGKMTLLYLINPGIPFSPASSGSKRSLILQLDCGKIGVKGSKITLTELFSGEIIRTSSRELKNGIPLEMAKMEGRMYLVEGK